MNTDPSPSGPVHKNKFARHSYAANFAKTHMNLMGGFASIDTLFGFANNAAAVIEQRFIKETRPNQERINLIFAEVFLNPHVSNA